MRGHFRKTTLSIAATQAALLCGSAAWGQTAPAPANAASAPADAGASQTIVVTGQRAALQSAQSIKQNSDEIVDSIVAEDIGKLPDKSVTEVLQRVVGVTIDHTMAKGDPEHFSVEGSGVTIRGLSYVRSELNGRDSFSANGGRALSFEDVPPELMSAVDVYKNPSAEQIEGAIGGLVNLRTALPFDFEGFKGSVSAQSNYSKLAGKAKPSVSGLISDRWNTSAGQFGALLDLAYSESAERTDAFQVEPYYPRTDAVPGDTSGQTLWIPKGSQWRTLNFDRKREGEYGALQWKKNDLSSSLTYFRSKYKMNWDEEALFAQSSPYNIQVTNGSFDANGVFKSGTLSDPTDGGINFNNDTRYANRTSVTQDASWHVNWKATPRWTFDSDLQYIKSTTESFDSTVATGLQIDHENVDLTGSHPQLNFDDTQLAYLADPSNYYWAFTMEHRDKSVGHEKVWKGDAKYTFDSPVLSDLRFGVRFTDRDMLTQNSNPSYNWAAITQPWQVGWDINHLAYLSDPRFSGGTSLHTFNNFFNGQASVPALVFPNPSLASGYPDSYAQLHTYHDILCAEQHNGDSSSCTPWKAATFGTDPSGTNDQHERTQAAYTQLRFAFDDLKYPVDGNVGVRVVHTSATANGYTVFTPPSSQPQSVPVINGMSQPGSFKNAYTDALPSVNLRMKASDQLQFRLAFAKGLTRPDFTQLQAYTSLSQTVTSHTVQNPDGSTTTIVDSVSYTGTAAGNPYLKPVLSDNYDATAEWYFSKTGSLTFALFDKQLKDVIINQTFANTLLDTNGQPHDFVTTGPVNGAKGTARGLEVAFQTYFDKLPGWFSGFGVQANYTYVDSHQSLYQPVYQAYCSGGDSSAANLNLNLNGCDTDGRTFGDLPLENLSRNAYNLALLYDKGPLSARLAYSWRSKYLQAVNVNGTQGTDGTDTNPNSATFGQHNVAWGLPTWAGDYGELDLGVFYKFTDNLTVGLEGQNLTDTTYKQLMQQHVGMLGRAWFSTGPRYSAQMRYSF
jgi:TonB-dependent receptor